MNNIGRYKNCFMRVFEVNEEELDEQFNFGAIAGWDSLAHMELISSLEDEFGVLFEPDDILNFGGYENGKRILVRYGVDFLD